jgi:hypothetical protein
MSEPAAETSPRTIRESGARVGSHHLRRSLTALQWISISVGLIGSVGTAGVGLWRWTLAYTQYGPAVVWRWSLPWFLAAAGLSPALILGLLSYLRNRKLRLDIYPSGLIFRRGRRTRSLAWQDIRALQHANTWMGLRTSNAGRATSLVLETIQGDRIRIPRELDQFERVVNEIKNRVYPRMQRSFSAAFNQGERLRFGPIRMDRDGLEVRGQLMRWNQVSAVGLEHGDLIIYTSDGRHRGGFEIAANGVPNVDLCYQMIQTVLEAL